MAPTVAARTTIRVLFITWDGPGQSYLESLFLPLFAALKQHGVLVHVLQLTWCEREETERAAQAARALGIPFEAFRVPRSLRTAGLPIWVTLGAQKIVVLCRAWDIAVLMPRSIIPAAMALLALRRCSGTRLVYEADGLMADERVDFAGWSASGANYRLLREVEMQVVQRAEVVTTRTTRARQILLARGGPGVDESRVFVIPNGKDENSFAPVDAKVRRGFRERAGVDVDAPWLVYAGSVGAQYHLPKMLQFFEYVRKRAPRARFHLLTWQALSLQRRGELGVGITVDSVPPEDVAGWLASADVGIALRTTSFSQRAVCPIKLVEYLMCGTPVIASPVGDFGDYFAQNSLGRVVSDLGESELQSASKWFVDQALSRREDLRRQCRAFALSQFALSTVAGRYKEAVRFALRDVHRVTTPVNLR